MSTEPGRHVPLGGRRVTVAARRRLAAILSSMVVVGSVSSCGAGIDGDRAASDGPLGVTEGVSGEWCLPTFRPDADISHGSEVLRNESDVPVEITGVSLVGASNLDLVAAYQLPLRGMLSGTLLGWPPREEAALTSLGRVPAGSRFNLVAHLRSGASGVEGSVDGVRISYEAEGRSYVATTAHSVVWRERC